MLKERYDERYLEGLIRTQVQESLHLDYKRPEALNNTTKCKREISKDVSAFANSDGGRIVYGMVEKGHIPVEIDGWQPVEGKREWLEQVINSNIQPRALGLRIHQIDLQSKLGKAVFVVEIPRSFTAHQANDKRYYRRFNFQSVPMHDYEVKQTINRAREPILRIELREPDPISLPIHRNEHILNLVLSNLGMVSARSAELFLFLPTELAPLSQGNWQRVDWTMPRQYSGVTPFLLDINPDDYTPLHPGKQMFISSRGPSDAVAVRPNNYATINAVLEGYIEIFAEDMEPRFGEIQFVSRNSWLAMNLKQTENAVSRRQTS